MLSQAGRNRQHVQQNLSISCLRFRAYGRARNVGGIACLDDRSYTFCYLSTQAWVTRPRSRNSCTLVAGSGFWTGQYGVFAWGLGVAVFCSQIMALDAECRAGILASEFHGSCMMPTRPASKTLNLKSLNRVAKVGRHMVWRVEV